ncbi:hypothetical protein C0J52_17307 [Blattella germanica]|nr:hypothetical protein C0J52_17307 [Blattella germanica]
MTENEDPKSASPLLERREMSVVSFQSNDNQLSTPAARNPQFYMIGNLVEEAAQRISKEEPEDENQSERRHKRIRRLTKNNLITSLSTMYAKVLVVLGIAFPVTEMLVPDIPGHFYEGFYMYLYGGSVVFIFFLYALMLKETAIKRLICRTQGNGDGCECPNPSHRKAVRYGSFYLRLGAIGFGIGSMVYSGLEFGQHFANKECDEILPVLRPATRMLLQLLQIQFIFLNNKDMKMGEYWTISRFGLMHMIATNLCEWLYVLVEETKHEIDHLSNHEHDYHYSHPENEWNEESSEFLNFTEILDMQNETLMNRARRSISASTNCSRHNIVGVLVQDASPFLFPCTIEYSLICAVTLYEMWKHLKGPSPPTKPHECEFQIPRNYSSTSLGKLRMQHFSVDCHSSHKGMFMGILVLVMTIISLVLFLVLNHDPQYKLLAVFEVSMCEMILYTTSFISVLICMIRIKVLSQELDNGLLIMAQAGMYMYCTFSVIGFYYGDNGEVPGGMATEIIGLIQTTAQTILVLDASSRRCTTKYDKKRKPGRQIVTFLIVSNMAMWMINTLEKGHAVFRPTHLKFYGEWAWAVITHVSMPLAIFYRFHSTICLFEIWKSSFSPPITRLEPLPEESKRSEREVPGPLREERGLTKKNKPSSNETLSAAISAFYCKLLVVVGLALPVTTAIIPDATATTYDGFYLYLYLGSLLFLLYMYAGVMTEEVVQSVSRKTSAFEMSSSFGVGSMIHAVLHFGMYFELKNNSKCDDILLVEEYSSRVVTRFGLMHMIATNLCEWLFVVVEEIKYDIMRGELDPCVGDRTRLLEFSHHGTLGERRKSVLVPMHRRVQPHVRCHFGRHVDERLLQLQQSSPKGQRLPERRQHHLLSLCQPVLRRLRKRTQRPIRRNLDARPFNRQSYHVNTCETVMFAVSTCATFICFYVIKDVGLIRERRSLELEHILLMVTQSAVFLYFMFQIIGGFFSLQQDQNWAIMRIVSPMFAVIQSMTQTILVLDAWKRRCDTKKQISKKPGKQLITFLLIANLAMWVMNRLKNSRVEFYPLQTHFYGVWAWTIITHISLPLVVCYRFQSTVCLYEIWKHVYKTRTP